MNRFIFLSALMLATPALAESDLSFEIVSTVPRPVVTQIVGAGVLDEITYIGTVAAGNEVSLGFPLSGTLVERRVDLGALVFKGDELARLDPKDFQAELRSAQAGVLVAETNLGAAQQAANRATELATRGVDSITRQEDAQRALVAAQAGLEQAQANLARAQDKLDLGILRAPQDGVITGAFLDTGASVSQGLEVLRLASTDEREAVVDVSEQGLADLDIGMRFDVALVANPNSTTTATLFRIDPVAESTTRTRRAHFLLSSPPQEFRFGALVQMNAIADDALVVSVPYDAVLTQNGTSAVWLVSRAQNTVSLQPVTLGARFGDRVRVTKGIAVGDEVVLRGIHSLHEGQNIGRSMSQ
ncbi:efflux RND transporter periplasmic adaptor subunit [Pacificibacter marinus]|uniref:Multidrug resistance protein MdtA n=1 Tax=Pacificibacter marinus TaxID=658057 RepID=A0A1Y5RJF2_9RHOB|nr:efflux RND transporter periplasmic adaptor subunit [Pacificibacter marinus]SEK18219.1 RND family efflux transporter, MFP subunit [Pacificibacter marinus]SLN18934.1 Multidrug resistance protein MdtA precursor [Pacificibacter marinus]